MERLATVRAVWTEDRKRFVLDTDVEARILAYPVGTVVAPADYEAYDAFLSTFDTDTDDEVESEPEPGGQVLAAWRVWLDKDGEFVHEGGPLAVSLRYDEGDVVDPDDVAAYDTMGEPPADVKEAAKASDKARKRPPSDKSGL